MLSKHLTYTYTYPYTYDKSRSFGIKLYTTVFVVFTFNHYSLITMYKVVKEPNTFASSTHQQQQLVTYDVTSLYTSFKLKHEHETEVQYSKTSDSEKGSRIAIPSHWLVNSHLRRCHDFSRHWLFALCRQSQQSVPRLHGASTSRAETTSLIPRLAAASSTSTMLHLSLCKRCDSSRCRSFFRWNNVRKQWRYHAVQNYPDCLNGNRMRYR